jgi:hypothetical protein
MIALNEAANYPEKSIALQNHIDPYKNLEEMQGVIICTSIKSWQHNCVLFVLKKISVTQFSSSKIHDCLKRSSELPRKEHSITKSH